MRTDSTILLHTQQWIEKVIIGCNFCPFAAKPYRLDHIAYRIADTPLPEAVLEQLIACCQLLDSQPEAETLLLILPRGFEDWEAYLDLLNVGEQLLELQGYEGVYQIASFHPRYCFAGAEADDPANYTNRSPYPMLHLLREDRLEQALEHYAEPEAIPERNVAYARQKGLVYMQMLRDSCLQHLS